LAFFRKTILAAGDDGAAVLRTGFLSMPFCPNAKHAETAVIVVEGDALYDAGNWLGRGSSLWHSSGHDWGFNFATDG
jgi:hypothetical protein